MRLELQKIGTICVALLLGVSMSLCLFFVMIFLIEPERMIGGHLRHPYVVTLIATAHKKKTGKFKDKIIKMPKFSGNHERISIRAKSLKTIKSKSISNYLPEIGPLDVYSARRGALDLDIGTEENYYSKDNRKVPFNQGKRKYSRSKKGETLPPERVRIPGGGEIDRIGNTCCEVSRVGGGGSGEAGQTAIEKDQSFAMHSLSAREAPCDKSNSSFAEDFLKQLKKRGLIKAPASVTN